MHILLHESRLVIVKSAFNLSFSSAIWIQSHHGWARVIEIAGSRLVKISQQETALDVVLMFINDLVSI